MCGIVGAVARRNVLETLVEGLRRLEYRGYDSAGVALLDPNNTLSYIKSCGKVAALSSQLANNPLVGNIGIAQTRWATHGVPSDANAHPHVSHDYVAVVHNGIIENYQVLKQELNVLGYQFKSQTDTEVVVHYLHYLMQETQDLLIAVQLLMPKLQGSFALAMLSKDNQRIVVTRRGAPLVLGLGQDEYFVASDSLAIMQVSNTFIALLDGDIANISLDGIVILGSDGKQVEREIIKPSYSYEATNKGSFRHYMHKEIFEQPKALSATLSGCVKDHEIDINYLGNNAAEILTKAKAIQIVACGTSFHAGMVAKYWLEDLLGLPCQVEVASEFRYRKAVILPGTLFISISQSGETADTLSALKHVDKTNCIGTLAICNVPGSSIVRGSDLCLLTAAGPEIGVASTKALTSQLMALFIFALTIGKNNKLIKEDKLISLMQEMYRLPELAQQTLLLETQIKELAQELKEYKQILFIGRGVLYPIAQEGSLKLKEISYIHAQSYPAGELKHGPLALVDQNTPVIALMNEDDLVEKINSNLQEIHSREGKIFVFASSKAKVTDIANLTIVRVDGAGIFAPLLFTIPLQLLAYHVAVLKGTDVDQPRNLAKSVTVE